MSFAKDIWDGVERVSDHISLQIQVAKDLSEFMSKRAKYEEDFAKHVGDLSKQLPGGKNPATAKIETTMRAAVQAMVDTSASLAKVHQELADVTNNDIVKPFGTFLKAKDADRKKLFKDGEKKAKTMKDMENTAKKAQDAYEKAVADAKKAVEEERKAKSELASNAGVKKFEAAAAKASATKKKAIERMEQAEKLASGAVDNANTCMHRTYDDEMPEILNALQKISEEIFEKSAEYLALFTDTHEHFEGPYKEAHEALLEAAKTKLDKDADLNEFIESAKSEKESYELLEFKKLPNPEEEEMEDKKEAPAAEAKKEEEKPKEEEKKEEEKKEEEKKEEEKKEEEKKEEEKKEEEKKEEEKKEEEKPKEEEKKEEEKKEEEKKEEEKPKEEEKKEEEKKEEEKKEEEKPAEEEKKEEEKKEEEKPAEEEKKDE